MRTEARLHPASPGGSWGPEDSFPLQVAATAALGTAAAMASCPDSDNSWVLAGSEVGETGLGCFPGLSPCWGLVVTCTTSCIGERARVLALGPCWEEGVSRVSCEEPGRKRFWGSSGTAIVGGTSRGPVG